jgi:hypothetical protein
LRFWKHAKTPAIYLLAYLATITSFTAIYVGIGPKNFYDSAVVHEDVFKDEQREFNKFLGNIISKSSNSTLITEDSSLLMISHVYPRGIRSTELSDGLISGFMVYVLTDYPEVGKNITCDFDFAFDTTKIWESSYDSGAGAQHRYAMLWHTTFKRRGVGRIGICDTERDLHSMFPEGDLRNGPNYSLSRERPLYIPLEERDADQMTALGLAFKGDPYFLSHDIQRMFYFSSTTITTVGFGDILPISETARVLTGIEAILGWIIAGLFINAVTQARDRTAPYPFRKYP